MFTDHGEEAFGFRGPRIEDVEGEDSLKIIYTKLPKKS